MTKDNRFVNLHNHSDYSLLDGYSHPGEYLKQAAALGQTAVGLTDHGNLFGAFEFIKTARGMAKTYDRKNHPQEPVFVKPIIGIEAYMAPQNPDGARCKRPVFYGEELNQLLEQKNQSKGRAPGTNTDEKEEKQLRDKDVSSRGAYTHLTLLAINDTGFHNLIHLTTNANRREHFYQHGRMDFEMLQKWNEGIIATTGCPSGEIQTRLRLGQKQEAYDYAERMAELFDGRYYVEVMRHNMDKNLERDALPQLVQLAKDLHLPLLATNDSHYARSEDAQVHEEMLCINSRKGDNRVTMDCLSYDDPREDIPILDKNGNPLFNRAGKKLMKPRRFAFSGNDYYLKTYDEMIKAFPEDTFPGAVSNTVAIADMVGDWWTKPDAIEIENLERKYKDSFNGMEGNEIDGKLTLPHATGGRTDRIEQSNKGITVIGSTRDHQADSGFEVDALSQKLIDDGSIMIGPYDMSLNTDLRPEIAIPEGWTEEEWFQKKIDEGFVQRRVAVGDSPELLKESKRRIAEEYDVFAGKNFIQYMLVVQDYINWAREHGVAVGEGRGSVGGSEIAYLMDISRTDPVRHDLIFERFLNPERNSPPDVDTDFQSSGMLKVLQYVKDRYGYDHVANIITFGTFQFKQAFTDIAKIYNFSLDEIERVKKLVPGPIDRTDPTMEDLFDPKSPFYEGATDFREAVNTPQWQPIIKSTSKMVGRVRSTGTHACGVIISSKPIEDYAPLTWNSSEEAARKNIWTDVQVCWEYPDLEALGLIKMDFLRLSELDIIDDAISNIESYNDTIDSVVKSMEDKDSTGKEINATRRMKLDVPKLDNIEMHGLTDENTYKMLAKGDSDAVFQLSSDGMKPLLQRVKPDSFEDLVAINALYRPGPMGQNAHLEYADRKNGTKPAYIINEKLDKVFRGTPVEEILAPTYMLMVYQEQIMQISRKLAGFTRGQADSLRKAMGHKIPEEMEANHKRFIKGAMDNARANGYKYTEQDLEELWKYIEIFSAYSFNRCVAGSTLVMDDKGVRTPVSMLYEAWQKNPIKRLQDKLDSMRTPVERRELERQIEHGIRNGGTPRVMGYWYDGTVRPVRVRSINKMPDPVPVWVVTVITPLGVKRSITITGNHRMLTSKGYGTVQDGDIKPGVMMVLDPHWNATQSQVRERLDDDPGFDRATTVIEPGNAPRSTAVRKMAEFLNRRGIPFELNHGHNEIMFDDDHGRPEADVWIPGLYGGTPVEMDDEGLGEDWYARHKYRNRDFLYVTPTDYEDVLDSELLRSADGDGHVLGRVVSVESLVDTDGIPAVIPVYDIEVWDEDPSSFIADGMVSHNSHSVSYAINAYKTAYLKANYRPFFMASVLTEKLGDKDKIRQLIKNVEESGLKVGAVDANRSGVGVQAAFSRHEDDSDIVFGFDTASGVNATQAKAIVKARNTAGGQFKDFDQFMLSIPPKTLNKTGLEGLAKAGAFDVFGLPRKAIAEQAASIVGFYDKKRKLESKASSSLLGLIKSSTGSRYDAMGAYDFHLTGNPRIDEWSFSEKLKNERDSVGLCLSGTPVSNAGPGLDFLRENPDFMRAESVEDLLGRIPEDTGNTKWGPSTRGRLVGWFSALEYRRYKQGTGGWFRGTFTDGGASIEVAIRGEVIDDRIRELGLDPKSVDKAYLEDVLYDVVVEVRNGRANLLVLDEVAQTWDGKVPFVLHTKDEKTTLKNNHVRRVISLLKSHPGDVPVLLDLKMITDPSSLPRMEGVVLQAGPNNLMPFKVDLTPGLMQELCGDRKLSTNRFLTWSMARKLSVFDPSQNR